MTRGTTRGFAVLAMLALFGAFLVVPTGCRRPRDGKKGSNSSGPVVVAAPSSSTLTDTQNLPGLVMTVLSPSSTDTFQAGDGISVNFTLTRKDGSPIAITDLDSLEAHISGPTFNYQRVIDETQIVTGGIIADGANLVYNDDGSYTYTFDGLPDNYIDPPNSAGTFTDGVLSGTPLLSGTYTFVFIGYRTYTVGGKLYNDVANVAQDFLFGDATDVTPRAVVAVENCNRCHIQLQMHDGGLARGGIVRDTRLCVTCHVAGAEDQNDPTVAGGTPDVTVEFKVMIHKIHNGAHLPSVLGIRTNDAGGNIGTRDMTAVPKPYLIVDDELQVNDFSGVLFPVFPSFNFEMPRNYGYTLSSDPTMATSLGVWNAPVNVAGQPTFNNVDDTAGKFTSPNTAAPPFGNGATWQANDVMRRKGVTACNKCHGDPDGDGPLLAPAQGDLIAAQPSRRACGACHDDVNFSVPYTNNLKTMPPQMDDSHCIECHVDPLDGGTALDPKLFVRNAHKHPLADRSQWPTPYNGFNIKYTSLTPSGVNSLLEPGETLQMKFRITDDSGADILIVPPGGLSNSIQNSGTFYNPTFGGHSAVTWNPLLGPAPTPAWGGTAPASGYPWPDTMSAWWGSFTAVLSGPTSNYNIVNVVDFPADMPALATGPDPITKEYTMNMPQFLFLAEFGGAAGVAGNTHNIVGGSATQAVYYNPRNEIDVEQVTADHAAGAASTMISAVIAGQNYVDVVHPATVFKKGYYVRVGGGAPGTLATAYTADREFLRISFVEALTPTVDRLWFTSPYNLRSMLITAEKANANAFSALYGPWLRKNHTGAAPLFDVVQVDIANRPRGGTGWSPTATLTPGLASSITEGTAPFTVGLPILVSYTTDFVMPAYYPPALYGGPDLDETFGCWTGKAIVPGTYSVNMWTAFPWAHRTDPTWPDFASAITKPWTNNIDYGYAYEVDKYSLPSPAATTDMLVGNSAVPVVPPPSSITPWAEISSSANCYTCHEGSDQQGTFTWHGSRKGFETCILCHGSSGAALHQNYVATPSGSNPPWDRGLKNTINFRYFLHNFHDADDNGVFPAMPEGVKNCAKCHGDPGDETAVWEVPHNRNHPMGQVKPVREWMNSCGGCHTTGDATAHFDLMTSPSGEESCGTCHNVGATYGVGIMHKIR